MKVLIGTDDSRHSRAAVAFVTRKLRLPEGTKVIVASVVQELVPAYADVYAGAPYYSEEISQELFKHHQEVASDAENELRAAGYETSTRVLTGDPRTALGDLCRLEGVDLLVVGSHGRTGLGKLLMGSVAAHLVAHAPCAVMVVKAQ